MARLMWTAKIPPDNPLDGEWGLDSLPTAEEQAEIDRGDLEPHELADELALGFIRFVDGKWRIFCFNWLKGMAFDDVEEAKAVFITLVRTVPIERGTDMHFIRTNIGFEEGLPYVESITG